MLGRILNKPLLDRAANLLNLEGVRRFPALLDTGDIKVVFDIGQLDTPVFRLNANHTGNLPANTSSVDIDLIGQSNITPIVANDNGIFATDANTEGRIISINASVGYQAAGAAADAALFVPLLALVLLQPPVGTGLAFPVQETFAIVENVSPYSFNWTFPQGARFAGAAAATYQVSSSIAAGWDGYVPPGWSCAVQIQRVAGFGFFPALTSVDTYFLVAQRPAMGAWRA